MKLCWGNEIEPSKAKLLPTTKWRNNDDSDLPCEPKNHRVVSRDDENSKRLTFYPPFALAKDSSTLEKIQAKNSYKMCAKVTPDGQYQFGHFILQNCNRKYELKSFLTRAQAARASTSLFSSCCCSFTIFSFSIILYFLVFEMHFVVAIKYVKKYYNCFDLCIWHFAYVYLLCKTVFLWLQFCCKNTCVSMREIALNFARWKNKFRRWV